MKKDNIDKIVEEELKNSGIKDINNKRNENNKKIIDKDNNLKSTEKNKILRDIILILIGIIWLVLMIIYK